MTSVGVLLPARLETRFDQRGGGAWRLRLIVVPGEAWFDRHDPLVTEAEHTLLQEATARRNTALAASDVDAAFIDDAAFDALGDQVGAGRAAWLVREFVSAAPDGAWSVEVPVDHLRPAGSPATPARVRGLPDRLEVWADVAAPVRRRVRLAVLRPRPDLAVEPPVPGDPPVYWVQWAALRRAGLAATVNLATADPDGGPIHPSAITLLTVVGLGVSAPAALFAAHAHAGEAALLAPGTPTNVGPDGRHPRPGAADWRATTGRGGSPELAAALTGTPGALPAIPGDERDHVRDQHLLVEALWPALWGRAIHELWGTPEGDGLGGLRSADWWAAHVRPTGPFPSLLVRDQPYGILPATTLRLAVPAPEPIEERLARVFKAELEATADRARQRLGTVVDGSTEQVLRVLRQTPTSAGFAYRWTVPAPSLGALVPEAQGSLVDDVLAPLGLTAVDAKAAPVALGPAVPVDLPLVEPPGRDDVPEDLGRLLEDLLNDLDAAEVRRLLDTNPKDPGQRHRIPLLWIWHRTLQDAPDPGSGSLDAVLGHLHEHRIPSLLARVAAVSLQVAHGWDPANAEAHERYHRVLAALRELALRPADGADLETTLAATLDCAVHRADALATALAHARLQRMAGDRRLGLYGWVESPFRGEPGLTDRGVVLAPSPDQAKVAALLKDRHVAHRTSGEDPAAAWDLALDSARTRTALGVVAAVREGAHPGEVVGRAVEACFHRYAEVRALRSGYPQDGAAPLRRTCDGLALLADLRDHPATFAARTGLDPTRFPADTTATLAELATVPADIADLLLVEAVHDTVTGGTAQSVAALDAAAGLAPPPDLRALATPSVGTPLDTTVLLGLPDVPEPVPAPGEDRPALCDPAIAAYLDTLGDATDPVLFGWHTDALTVTLADLRLAVSDLAVVEPAILQASAERLLGPGGADTPVPAGVTAVRAVVEHLRRTGEPTGPVDNARLGARYSRLRAAGLALADEAVTAGAAAGEDLRARLLRWGLIGEPAEVGGVLREHLAAFPDTAEAGLADLRRLVTVGRPNAADEARVAVLAPVPALPAGLAPFAAAADWHAVLGRVRPRVAAQQAHTTARGWVSHACPADTPWTGAPRSDGAGASLLPGSARTITVLHAPPGLAAAGGGAVVGVVDSWQEALPGRWSASGPELTVPATAAFGFNTPAARPPQAILLAVPPTPDTPLDLGLVREIVADTRLLAQVRTLRGVDLGPLGAVLPSAVLPLWQGLVPVADGVGSPASPLTPSVRLEQAAPAGDLDRALRADVGDPLWQLARQWQLGEWQGENASSPAEYRALIRHTPLVPPAERPFADPVRVPGEAVLEAAAADWWPAAGGAADPYLPATFTHAARMRGGGANFSAIDHAGGSADWWSMDASGTFRSRSPSRVARGLPGRMRYPGAPAPGWFTLEDPAETVTAHLPDPAHLASLFFLDVLAGHSTDWYLATLATPPGHVLTVTGFVVRDVFGDVWRAAPAAWEPVGGGAWSLYRTRALTPRDLLVWFATPTPLQGPVLEQVAFGVDEDANLLWAVEEVVEGDDGAGPPVVVAPESPPATPKPAVRYTPLGPAPGRWHPYQATDGADARRMFRQARLRVPEPEEFAPPPAPTSRLLVLGPDGAPHEVEPRAVPAAGVVVERRWVLARAADGAPVLWQQRWRRVPLTTTAQTLAFDVTSVTP